MSIKKFCSKCKHKILSYHGFPRHVKVYEFSGVKRVVECFCGCRNAMR